jgi:hypothetical protein
MMRVQQRRKTANSDYHDEGAVLESAQGEEEEEHTVEMLTQWEIELRMLEDWLDNLEPTDDCQKTVMQIQEKSIRQNCSKFSARKLNRK